MKRRDFLKSGIATVVAGASAPYAFGEIFIPTGNNISQAEMQRFISELDTRMDSIAHNGGDYINAIISRSPDDTEQTIFRSNLRSLMLIGSFGELPIKGQAHPWMQKRLKHSSHEVNYSVYNSFQLLKNMTEEQMDDMKTALSDEPGLGTRILEALDQEAKSVGIPSARRRQMRVMGNRIFRRMKHSPELLIDEYVKKTEKLLVASNSNEAFDRMFKMQVGEENYETLLKEAESAAREWDKLNIPDDRLGYTPLADETSDVGALRQTHNNEPLKGLRLLGVGAAMTVFGLIILQLEVSFWLGAILGITLGPILIIIALIVMIVSSIKRSQKK
jgi:hypothetical protein